jgi:hypothetical protein
MALMMASMQQNMDKSLRQQWDSVAALLRKSANEKMKGSFTRPNYIRADNKFQTVSTLIEQKTGFLFMLLSYHVYMCYVVCFVFF